MVDSIKELKKGKIYWLIRKIDKGHEAIGFIREKHKNGFLIIGGPTGSYFGGHGENWRVKLKSLISEGYILESLAKKRKIIHITWKPPKLSKEDKELMKLSFNVSKKILERSA